MKVVCTIDFLIAVNFDGYIFFIGGRSLPGLRGEPGRNGLPGAPGLR